MLTSMAASDAAWPVHHISQVTITNSYYTNHL